MLEAEAINRGAFLVNLMMIMSASLLTALAISLTGKSSPEPTVFVIPSSIAVTTNQTFVVNIEVSDVTDLYGWEFKLGWNSSLLEAINITEKSFLGSGGDTYFVSRTINTEGYILVGCTLLRNITGAGGNGTLATVEFRAKKEGSCILDLYDTKLVNSFKQLTVPSDFDSIVTITKTNIAVTNVSLSKTVVGQGYSMSINVTVVNQGDFNESFNVSVFYDDTVIILPDGKNYTTTTLTNGNSTTLTIPWNTTDVAKGNYTITAKATPIPGETDTTDNTHTNGIIQIVTPGDINADGKVDMKDIGLLCLHFGAEAGDPLYVANYDINCDGKINMKDIGICCLHYGEEDP